MLSTSFKTNEIVFDWTDSLSVAVTRAPADTPVAPVAGVCDTTVGAVLSTVTWTGLEVVVLLAASLAIATML